MIYTINFRGFFIVYKLMLIDDEDMVRKRVINNIDWAEHGFEIVCEAENGNEGYELFQVHKPDVIITDIKMPFMDGLELSEKIMNDYPFTKIIVLTGFDEFEYAKKSVDLHIMKYILKPVSMKELVTILKETKDLIDQEIEEKRSLERLKRHYDQSFPLMRQRFLEGLIRGEYTEETIEKWLVYYHVPIEGELISVSVVKIDDFYADKIVKRSSEIELRKIALLDMVEDLDKRYPMGAFFLYNDYVVIINSMTTKDENVFLQEMISTMDKLRQGVERFLDFTVTVGIGYVTYDKTELKYSYESAMSAHDYKLTLGKNQVLYINDMEPNNQGTFELNDIEQTALRRHLKTSTEEEYTEYINALFEKIVTYSSKQEDVRVVILELIAFIVKTEKELDVKEIKDELSTDLKSIIEHIDEVEYVKDMIVSMGIRIIKNVSLSRVDTTKALVVQAKDYVIDNYSDFELNIESISAHLHYSPNYFSSIFKKETGIPFMKYLLDLRLEKAKELLVSTTMKNFEIAVEVGFSSANYFSFCFKKELGMSPSTFKKQGIN